MGCQQARLALIGSHLNLATSGQRRESREKLSKTCHFEIGKIRTSSHTMTQCWQGKRRGPLHKQKGFVASSGIKPSTSLGCNRPVCLPIQQMCFPSCQICGTTFWKCSMSHDQHYGFPAGTFITWMFSTDQGYFEPPSPVSCRSLLGCNTPRDLLPVESESKGYKHDKAKIYKGINPLWEENKVVKRSRPYLESGGVGRR